MNEIKYELDKYMGDTSDMTERIKRSVKTPSRQKKNNSSNGLTWLASIAALLIIGIISYSFFSGGSNTPPIATPVNPIENPPVTSIEDKSLKGLFHEDGVYSYFAGDMHEYSSYIQATYWLDENHVQLVKDNTGGITTEIYRITDTEIQLIFSGMHNEGTSEAFKKIQSYKDFNNYYVSQGTLPFDPSVELSYSLTETLQLFDSHNIYFASSAEVGQQIGDYTVVEILDELMIAEGLYKNVYVLERTEDNFVYTQYFSNPGGLIKWTHKSTDDSFVINGELQVIHGNWTKDSNQLVEIKNWDNSDKKGIILDELPIVKSYLLTQMSPEIILANSHYIDIPTALSSQRSYILEIPMNEFTYYSFLITDSVNSVKELALGMNIKQAEEPIVTEHFSPTGQYYIYKLNSAFSTSEGSESFDYTITKLILMDLYNSTIVYPTNSSILFDYNSLPITTIEWKDPRTFTVGIADIGENSYYEIEQWYKKEDKPVNYIDFTLE